MAEKAKHAFGNSENLKNALDLGTIDAYDILFLDGDTEPKVGWIDKNGDVKIVKNTTDLSGIEAELKTKANSDDVETLESQIATKADAKEINTKFDTIETALDEVANASCTHEKIKYEIADAPIGTLVNYSDREIRIMCPKNSVWTKQSVGAGGDANCYYVTFKTYVPNDAVVGYKEHLDGQVDKEILIDLKTDKYGRKYQPTWLSVAKYDEYTGEWSYYGSNSTANKFIGWDYQIDWFNADGVMIASDCVRINLTNEDCHTSIEPYYVSDIMKEVDTKFEEIETKIAEVTAYEVIEF